MEIQEKPIWKEGVKKPQFPKLAAHTTADVVIVGAGITGLVSAYMLARAGKSVAVLEKKKIGSGATEYTTAFLTQVIDTELSELVNLFGETKAKLIWQSHHDAINDIEAIIKDEQINCDFARCLAFVYANNESELEEVQSMSGTAQKFGFAVSSVRQDGKIHIPNMGYMEVPDQAKFHPLKFVFALAAKLQAMGVQIYQESEVTEIEHDDKEAVRVQAGEYTVSALDVIVATYQPFHNRLRMFIKRGMYKSYVLGVKLKKGLLSEGLYFDTANPYHYFRIDALPEYDQMILGGEDSKSIFKIDPSKSFGALAAYLNKIVGEGNFEISNQWTGPILEPSDGIALIGATKPHEYIASAFSGNGMTYAAIAGTLLRDQILGRQNVYTSVYDPKRIPGIKQLIIKGEDYIGEFFGGVGKNIFRKKQPGKT